MAWMINVSVQRPTTCFQINVRNTCIISTGHTQHYKVTYVHFSICDRDLP